MAKSFDDESFSKFEKIIESLYEKINRKTGDVFDKFQFDVVDVLGDFFSEITKKTSEYINNLFSKLSSKLSSNIERLSSELFKKFAQVTRNFFSKTLTVFSGLIKKTVKTISSIDFSSIKASFVRTAISLGISLRNAFETSISFLKSGLKNIGPFLQKFVLNPLKVGFFGLAGLIGGMFIFSLKRSIDLYKETDKAAQSLREQTGLTARMLSKEIYASLGKISVRLTENVKYLSEAFSVFGTTLNSLFNQENLVFIGQMADRLGISAKSSAIVLKQFVLIGRYSQKSAQDVSKMAVMMAETAKVAPNDVFEELSNASEEVYNFIGANPKKLVQTAVYARQIGIEMNKIANISRKILDLENSITNEMEASVLLGKKISFDKARTLALNNDLVGSFNEILNQVGGIDEYNRMSFVQREAIAKAVGLESDKLGNVIAMREELAKAKNFDIKKQRELNQALMEGNFEKAKGILKSNQMIGREESLERKRISLQRKLGQQLYDILEKAQPITDKIYQAISDLIPEIGKFFESTEIKSSVISFIEGIKNIDFKAIVEGGRSFFSILEKIIDAVKFVYDKIGATGIAIGLLTIKGIQFASSISSMFGTAVKTTSSIAKSLRETKEIMSTTSTPALPPKPPRPMIPMTSSRAMLPMAPSSKPMIPIESPIDNVINDVSQKKSILRTLFGEIKNMFMNIGEFIKKTLTGIGKGISGFLSGVGQGLGQFISGLSTGLASGLRVLGPALASFFGSFMNPATAIGIAIVTAGVLGFATALRIAEPVLIKALDVMQSVFSYIRDVVITTINAAKDVITQFIGKNKDAVDSISDIGTESKKSQSIIASFSKGFENLTSIGSKAFDIFSKMISPLTGTLGAIGKVAESVGNAVSSVFDGFAEVTKSAAQSVGGWIKEKLLPKKEEMSPQINKFADDFTKSVTDSLANKIANKDVDLSKVAGLSEKKRTQLKENIKDLAKFFDENSELFQRTLPIFYQASMAMSLLSESINFNEQKFKGIANFEELGKKLPGLLQVFVEQKGNMLQVNEALTAFTTALNFEESKFSGLKQFGEFSKHKQAIIDFLQFVNDNYGRVYLAGSALKQLSEGLKDDPFAKLKLENSQGLEKLNDFFVRINIYGEEGISKFTKFFSEFSDVSFNEERMKMIIGSFVSLSYAIDKLRVSIEKFDAKKFNSILQTAERTEKNAILTSNFVQQTKAERLKELKMKTEQEKNVFMKMYYVMEKIYEEILTGEIVLKVDGKQVGRAIMASAKGL